jgi:DNA-directed RNA polymerase subunit K/omega
MKRMYVPLEELLSTSQNSVFKLTMLMSKRGMQIAEGSKLLVERVSEKPLDNALIEILNRKVRVKDVKEAKEK